MSKKETYDQGYSDATLRLMGCLAENPTAEFLEGFVNKAQKIICQIQARNYIKKRFFLEKVNELEYIHGELIEDMVYVRNLSRDKMVEALMKETGMDQKHAQYIVEHRD